MNQKEHDRAFRFSGILGAATVAPEPATIALLAAGLLPVLGVVVRKHRK